MQKQVINDKLFKDIDEKVRNLGEVLLYLIYRSINPVDFFSRFTGVLEDVNYCINVFSRYGIIEYIDTENNSYFKLKRPLFIHPNLNEDYDIQEIRKYFSKRFCKENYRNTTIENAEYLMMKFREKYPYKWEDIISVTKEFMTDLMKKPEKDRYIPKFETFINKHLLILLEDMNIDVDEVKDTSFDDFLL